MTGQRRLLLDECAGERRGVVLLDGAPERLLIERDGEERGLEPGMTCAGRIKRVDRKLNLAFVDVGGAEAVLPLGKLSVVEGAAVIAQVVAPARRDKAAVIRIVPASDAGPLNAESPTLLERLQAEAPGRPIERGPAARDAADMAEDAIEAIEHRLTGGGSLSLEVTRGFTAIDVDVGGAGSASRVNRAAIFTTARLLRLNGLGGLVVLDLAGGGGRGEEIMAWAKAAFAVDMPGVVYGPVSRLGVFHLAIPWRTQPLAERLFEADGRPTVRTMAQRLIRAIEREAAFAVRVRAVCAPEVAQVASGLGPALQARLGPRFQIEGDSEFCRSRFEVRAL